MLFFLLPGSLAAQLVFVAPAQFGGLTGTAIFQNQNGTVTALPTGFPEHNFPTLSRDNRFIVFSSPDGVEPGLQVPPSSDIYLFDRAAGSTRRIVDHQTLIFSPSEVDSFLPITAALSPDNTLLAYGVMLTRRQGLANPRSTRELNIARASDGLILANPTFGRGPVSDSFQAEFVGLSWDPGGNSFVTPSYATVPTQSGSVVQLPAIVRYARDNAGNWFQAEVLSRPRYFDGQFPIAAEVHLYPAISPSGAGLAYFQITWPDVFGSSQGVICRLMIADSDGGNARELTTFPEAGTYPAGLAWAPDGSVLVASTARQASSGVGFLPSALPETAVLRTFSTSNGAVGTLPGIDAGFFPMWRTSQLNGSNGSNGSLAGVRLRISSPGGSQFQIHASGVVPDRLYFLQSSPTLQPGSFGPPQSFTGGQLAAGVNLNLPTPTRFFRLVLP